MLRIVAIALSCLCMFSISAEIIHKQRSLYRNILVDDDGDIRCLKFSVRKNASNQSCMDKSRPTHLVFDYSRRTLAGLLLNPQPQRILIVGLGGGSLPNTFAQLFPQATVDVVEIDAAVLKVAQQYFNFKTNANMQVHVNDARVFIKRAGLKSTHWDYIILDAFNGDYIPEHLLTKEFLTEVKQVLSDNGVLVANTFSNSRLYDYESVTYQQVWGSLVNIRGGSSNNRVILAQHKLQIDQQQLNQQVAFWQPRLQTFGADMEAERRSFDLDIDWDVTKPALTDQYHPANLLR